MEAMGDLTAVSLQGFVDTRGEPVVVDPTKDLNGSSKGPDPLPKVPAERLEKFHAAVTKRGKVCVVLAAGQGSRFIAPLPKVIYPFSGKPLAQHAVDAAAAAGIPAVLIVGHARTEVCAALDGANAPDSIAFVVQEEQMGTGHAVFLAKYALPVGFDGDIVIMYADNPGVDAGLVEQLLGEHEANKQKYGDKYGAMILTGSRASAGDGADAYGRIVRAQKDGGPIVDIVEKKTVKKLIADGTPRVYGGVEWTGDEIDNLDEFNSGIVVARAASYMGVLSRVTASQTKFDPPKYEYYATDFVKGMVADGLIAEGWTVPKDDMWKLEGANTLDELHELQAKQEARRSAS